MGHNVLPAASVRDLLVVCLSFLYCLWFGECQPPETARIARLTAPYLWYCKKLMPLPYSPGFDLINVSPFCSINCFKGVTFLFPDESIQLQPQYSMLYEPFVSLLDNVSHPFIEQ
jgi:hypothetical protein